LWDSWGNRRGSTAETSLLISWDDADADEDDCGSEAPPECLVWQFALEEFDIGFQVMRNETVESDTVRYRADEIPQAAAAPATGLSPLASGTTAPATATGTPLEPFEGTVDALKVGDTVTLRWDNTYSLVRHKQVRYRLLATSGRALDAAKAAAEELQLRADSGSAQARRRMPFYAKDLAEMRVASPEAREKAHRGMVTRLEQCVMDLVAIFMTNPNCPLHEGAVRALILALEGVLLDGVREEFLGIWPEAPYYRFLADLPTVLRDDTGVVAEVKALQPPLNLQCIGWNRSRALLLTTLNKGIFHRAFEVSLLWCVAFVLWDTDTKFLAPR